MARPSHAQFMKHALILARRGRGCVSPNPLVGCVIVHYGKIVAEGYHRAAGKDHAEVAALKKLDPKTVGGATLYVTLEPCNHFGKTPPCTNAILASGIRRVVVGARDPNPQVNGIGIKCLKEAGLEVIEQVMHEECTQLNAIYNKYITTGLPYVLLKVGLTLDGKIATRTGDSKWITNAKARQYAHTLREEVDAILIGGNTLRKDDPMLTIRLPESHRKKQPAVIILDDTMELPKERKLFTQKDRQVIFATTPRAPLKQKEWLEKMGFRIWEFESDTTGRLDVRELLKRLGKEKITSLLVEGGGGVYTSFMEAGVVDRVVAMIAPKMFGGQGRDWLPNLAIPSVRKALALQTVSIKVLGNNVVMEGELE